MENLDLFSIGFRCESIKEFLADYPKTQIPNNNLINASKQIIQDCFIIKDPAASFLSNSDYDTTSLMPIIFEYFKGSSISDAISKLTAVETILDQIKENKTIVKTSVAMDFFSDISEICLNKSAEMQDLEAEVSLF